MSRFHMNTLPCSLKSTAQNHLQSLNSKTTYSTIPLKLGSLLGSHQRRRRRIGNRQDLLRIRILREGDRWLVVSNDDKHQSILQRSGCEDVREYPASILSLGPFPAGCSMSRQHNHGSTPGHKPSTMCFRQLRCD